MKNALVLLYRFLASYGFAVVLLIFLFIDILLGTLYQVDHGLYEAQKKYFDSLIVMHQAGPLVIPLPGAYLLMALFGVNLVLGGLVRIRKEKRTLGIIITHLGILHLIIGGAVTFHYADRGNMRLFEGQTSDEFYSYFDWIIEVGKPESGEPYLVIPETDLRDLFNGGSRTFYAEALPFELSVNRYLRNAVPRPQHQDPSAPAAGDFVLSRLEDELEAEMNVAGAHLTVTDKETGHTQDGIIWGLDQAPLTVESGGETWTIGLERKRWSVPFTITLEDFRREVHAGTNMDASFESDVIKTENGNEEKIRIWMNHPLRHEGYTFFQASWGPEGAGPDDPMFSVFSVVRNPADQWPLYACIIIGVGLTLHFGQRLARYIRVENKRRAA